MKIKKNKAFIVDTQKIPKVEGKEINVTAMMTVREMVGWSQKTLLFTGETLSQFLKHLTTRDGKNLYSVLVRNDGAMKQAYMVWLNNRQIKEDHSLEIPLHGDLVLVASLIVIFLFLNVF